MAWTILEENVDDSYMISEEQEKMIFAWDEFRIGTGINGDWISYLDR